MDDDGGQGPRVARAGRRAAKKFDWTEGDGDAAGGGNQQDGAGPPEVAGTAFGEPQQQDSYNQRPGRQDAGDEAGGPAGASGQPPLAVGADGGSKKFIGMSRRKAEQLSRGDEETVRKNQRYEDLAAGADGIMDIPELEDEGKEDLSHVVAAAPKVRTNKVQGMSELDEDMHYRLPTMDDRDIDLSLLTAVLCASEQVQEDDEVWDPEILLTEVASAVNNERDAGEQDADKKDAA